MSHSQAEWEQKTFGDFVSIKRGYDLTSQQRKSGNVPVYGAAGQNGYHIESKAKAPGVVIGRSGGSFGKVHFVTKDFWPHNTAMYVTDFKGNAPDFVYYLLKLLDFSALNSGSAQPSLNRNFLYPVKIKVPKPVMQTQIGALLSNLDKKIELNNRINTELEGMAKLIYDYWFVQFDFPDANGKPYKSSGGEMVYNEELKREIPVGWDVSELGELISFERGISYKSKEISGEGTPMINLNSFDLTGKYKSKGLKYFTGSYSEKKIVSTGDLVIAITDVTRNADIIGKAFTIPDLFDDDILISCDVAKIVQLDLIDKQFLESLFNSNHYHNYIKYFASGTLVLHLNLDGVNWCKIPLPPKELLNRYSKFRQQIDKKLTLVIKENKKLYELRDWLLPMLMNGQVTVKDL